MTKDEAQILVDASYEAERILNKIKQVKDYDTALPNINALGTEGGANCLIGHRLIIKIQDLVRAEINNLLRELKQGEPRCQ